MKDNFQKYGEDEFYTNNYYPEEVALCWSKEYIKSMESIPVISEALIERNKWFSDPNEYLDDCHVKWMKNFGHNVDAEEDEISKDEESEDDYE